MADLFSPWNIGPIELKHRIVLAPLTRVRAEIDSLDPNQMMAEYYEQRASDGGLVIAEATYPCAKAGGMVGTPGLYTDAHVAEWKHVTDRVHAKGGKMIVQLWALGWTQDGKSGIPVVSASDKPMKEGGPVPHSLTKEEIAEYVADYASSAKRAMDAGFDGIEVHGAHGYLVNQFFSAASNHRTDNYGGSIENRARFGIEILEACAKAIGPGRVGIRLSPYANAQGVGYPEAAADFVGICKLMHERIPELGYVHFVEPRADPAKLANWGTYSAEHDVSEDLQKYRDIFKGSKTEFLSAGGYTPELARAYVEEHGGAVVFGRWFISNPDLPERIKNDIPLVKYDRPTFYTRGPKGYTDYPRANA